MKGIRQHTLRAQRARSVLLVAALAAMGAAACETGVEDLPFDDMTGGTGGGPLDGAGPSGGSVGDGGRTSSGGGGMGGLPGSGGSTFTTDGGAPSAEGGAAGSPNLEFLWLEQQGTDCAPTSASPSELPSEPSLDCEFFEIGLPGVLEYLIDPSDLDMDRDGVGGLYEYLGCDEVGAPCAGKVEYNWEVEYLADNEWHLSISPVHEACDYDHVLLHELPTGELSPRGTLSWTSLDLILHLQPTPTGLTIGAVRSDLDEEIETGVFTEMQYNGGWPEMQLRKRFDAAFIAHLKALEWECDQP